MSNPNTEAEVDKLVKLYFDSKDNLEPVPARELMQRARKGLVTVLDVRPVEEYAAGHIPGAINVPVGDSRMRLKEIPRDREIVAWPLLPAGIRGGRRVAQERAQGPSPGRRFPGVEERRASG